MDLAHGGAVKALALNAGSSSLKAALYEVEPAAALAAAADVVWDGQVGWDPGDGAGPAREMLETLPLGSPSEIAAVGHRIVHGGERFREPARLTEEVKAAVRSMSASAPLHNAAGLEGVAAAEAAFGDAVPQVAVFDTAFHAGLAPAAYAYAGPHEWLARGLRRYGFHGINHEYAAHRAASLLGRPLDELRLITCHLGSGCSLAAIRDGRSVDTTMGFTPLEGVVMGTRSGSLDPGLILHLLREEGASVDGLDGILTTTPACAASRVAPAICARCSRRASAARNARGWRSTSMSTGCASTSAPCSARSEASTRWCSPPGSASTPPRSARRRCGRSGSWAWRSTRTATAARSPTATSARKDRRFRSW